MAYKIVHNRDYNNNEIYFDKAPSQEIRTALKQLGMRWSPTRYCWYGYATRDQITDAVCGMTHVTVSPSQMSEAEFVAQYRIDTSKPVIWTSDYTSECPVMFPYKSAAELEQIRINAAKYAYRKLIKSA